MKPSCSQKSTLELRVNKNRVELVRSEESSQESESSAADARDNCSRLIFSIHTDFSFEVARMFLSKTFQ